MYPLLKDDNNRLLHFDRIVMNPPFSLEDWGYDEFSDGDRYERFTFGMPPRDNGDYAWLQQVVASLADAGRAIVVMSQGVLFRGQPEQTEEEDGRRQKADAEYVIRRGFVEGRPHRMRHRAPAKTLLRQQRARRASWS